jgi:DNA-binding IclR family transcriptional regulator
MVAKEGVSQTHEGLSRVGERRPFLAPLGIAHVAWSETAIVEAFLANAPTNLDAELAAYLRRSVEMVRRRGYSIAANGPNQYALRRAFTVSVGATRDRDYWPRVHALMAALSKPEIQLHDFDQPIPDGVCYISAPVFGPTAGVELELALSGMPLDLRRQEIERYASRLCATAAVITAEAHGRPPV